MTMHGGARSPIDRVLEALADHGCNPKPAPGGWSAKCPAHEDHNPSMSIRETETGNVLLCCHAGCLTSDVTKALGLTFTDLFPEKPPKVAHIRDGKKFKSRYIYTTADGTPIMSVVRLEPKTFRQYRLTSDGEWVAGVHGIERVLYRLPQVLRAKADRKVIWIVEGEKDVETLDNAWGYAATCNLGGADAGNGSKWLTAHTETLAGAEKVVIIADRDGPGRRHARYVATQLRTVVGRVAVYEPCTGKDVSDHIRAGHTPHELVKVWDSVQGPDTWLTDQPPDTDALEREPTTWRPVDLTDALNGIQVEPPEILVRTDGRALLYRGRVHWFQGEPESLKTWVALAAVVETIAARQHALMIDFEDDDKGVVARLLDLGLTPDQISGQFVYLRPDEPKGAAGDAEDDFADALEARPWAVVVLDGVTEAMTIEGLDLNSNSDVATFMRRLPKRIAAEPSRPAVVCLDHVTKSTESRGRWAIGGQHKLAGITGATYSFEVVRPLARASVEPIEAIVTMRVEKDRPGHVRGLADEKVVASVAITAYPDGSLTVDIRPPSSEVALDLGLCRRILEHLKLYDGHSQNQIIAAVKGGDPAIRAAVKAMADRGWIRVEMKGQTHRHWITDEGRDEVE